MRQARQTILAASLRLTKAYSCIVLRLLLELRGGLGSALNGPSGPWGAAAAMSSSFLIFWRTSLTTSSMVCFTLA